MSQSCSCSLYIKCGVGGSFSCSGDDGCYCRYSIIIKDTQAKTYCPDCEEYCQTKGKSEFTVYGIPTQNIPLSNIKRLPNGSWDIKEVQCFCTCK